MKRKEEKLNTGQEAFTEGNSWIISLKKQDAMRVVALLDGWVASVAEKLRAKQSANGNGKKASLVDPDSLIKNSIESTQRLRDRLDGAASSAFMSVSRAVVPDNLKDQVENLMKAANRTRNHVLRTAVLEALPLMSSDMIEKALPMAKPSLSSVLLLAIQTGLPLAESKMTARKIQPAVVLRETAAVLLEIYDEWYDRAVKAGASFAVADTERLRKEVQGDQKYARLAVYVPFDLQQQIDWIVENTKPARTKNFLLRQAIERGLPGVTGKGLRKQLPQAAPSLSAVLVHVLRNGVPIVHEKFKVEGSLPPSEDTFKGRSLVLSQKQVATTVTFPLADAQPVLDRLVELRNMWARRAHVSGEDRQAIRAQTAINQGNDPVLGIHAPKEIRTTIGTLARRHLYNRHFIVKWSVAQGLKGLTLKKILEAMPEGAPTLTNVAGIALNIGLEQFPDHFPVIESDPETIN